MRGVRPAAVLAKGPLPWGLAAAAFFPFSLGFLIPVLALLVEGLRGGTGAVPWTDGFLWHVVAFTYGQAFLSALLSGVVGIPAAVFFSEYRFVGRRLLWRLSLLPFALPTLLVALGLLGVWGQSGWIGRFLPAGSIYGWAGILLGHVFLNFPLYLKGVGTALEETEREPERAALTLGSGRWRCFFTITWRRILPEVRTAFFLSFLYCASSFLIVLFLGGGPRFTTLEVAIYQAIKVDFDPRLAVRLAVIQAVVSLLVYFLFLRPRRAAWSPRGQVFPLYRFRTPRLRAAVLATAAMAGVLLVGLPLAVLVAQGLPSLGSLDGSALRAALLHSLELGVLSTAAALAIGLGFAYGAHRLPSARISRALEGLSAAPLAVSTLLMTVGWLITLREKQDWLRGSLVPAAWIQALVALPPVFRTLTDGFRRIPGELYAASASLGACPGQTFRHLEWPLLGRSLALAAVLALSFSLGEVGAVLLFVGPEKETLPLFIFRLMGRYEFGQAYAAALWLLGGTALAFWWLDRGEGPDVRIAG